MDTVISTSFLPRFLITAIVKEGVSSLRNPQRTASPLPAHHSVYEQRTETVSRKIDSHSDKAKQTSRIQCINL